MQLAADAAKFLSRLAESCCEVAKTLLAGSEKEEDASEKGRLLDIGSSARD